MQAYTEDYYDDAIESLGEAIDYAVNVCNIPLPEFGRMFAKSQYSDLFGKGIPFVVAGMSGIEFAIRILDENCPGRNWPRPTQTPSFGPEYWAGWALAQYQWRSCRTFKSILEKVPIEEIAEMYYGYGENLVTFFNRMDELMFERKGETKLKKLRCLFGLSQSELSEQSGVKLRSIQMWEQRVNNIDKAQANSLYRLAHVLHCNIEELLEDPVYCGEIHLDKTY